VNYLWSERTRVLREGSVGQILSRVHQYSPTGSTSHSKSMIDMRKLFVELALIVVIGSAHVCICRANDFCA
jgi:hypothetical protein